MTPAQMQQLQAEGHNPLAHKYNDLASCPKCAVDDLDLCRQILAADMTHLPTDAPLPPLNFELPPRSVAFALYGAITELRDLRARRNP